MGNEIYTDQEKQMQDIEFFRNAEAFYTLLSSIYYLELSEGQIEGLASSGFDYPDDGSEMGDSCKKLRLYLSRRGANARQDLAVEYARIFLAAGVYEGKTAVPFESVFTSSDGILMQDSRDEVVKIYASNGLVIPRELNIPEDHLSFELEFLAHTSKSIAESLENDSPVDELIRTQISFIDEHLLNWIPQLQERVDAFAKLPFYPAIMSITKAYLEEYRAVISEVL